MNRWGHTKRTIILSSAVALWLSAPLVVWADNATVTTDVVHVKGTWAEEEAKLNSQQVQIITKKEIEKKQAKSVEDIILRKQVYLEQLMLWDVLACPFAVQKRVTLSSS